MVAVSRTARPVAGVRLAAARAGIRAPDRLDLALIELAAGGTAAAVFTRNAFCAAPVVVAREHLARMEPRYLLINAGNANAGTGQQGLARARASCAELAAQGACADAEVLPFSTGVIGEPLPLDALTRALPQALAGLDPGGWEEAARAIMTTDTRPKIASARIEAGGQTLTLTGIAKGAGMICPDMATMLAFVATDAAVERPVLREALLRATEQSFNCITVDGDTSTNDACVLLASGRSGLQIPAAGAARADFDAALCAVCTELAQAIVRDGEGATKFLDIEVSGARDHAEARAVAYTVAHSPLVKTAFYAADPNWGRILAAVGRAGLRDLDIAAVEIRLGELCIVRHGGRAPDYDERAAAAVMSATDVAVRIELGRGGAAAHVWTTDLSLDYVRINADYRT